MADKLASLGIDWWSMLLYLINTGVLLVILTYFLYKPILRFIDERRKQITDSIEESKKLREAFEKKLEESEKQKEKVEAELREEIDKLHKLTERKRTELIAEMDAKRTEMLQKTQEEIEQKKNGLIKEAESEIRAIMAKIILEIVENKVPENVVEESIQSAWKKYSN